MTLLVGGVLSFACGTVCGPGVAWYWSRLHGPDLTERARKLLAAVGMMVVPAGLAVAALAYGVAFGTLRVVEATEPTSWGTVGLGTAWFAAGLYSSIAFGDWLVKPRAIEPGLDGVTDVTLACCSVPSSLLWFAWSIPMVAPAVLIALIPRLRPRRVLRVRIVGELVEVTDRERVERVRMAGGGVVVETDRYGTPCVILRGRDRELVLPVGGAHGSEVERVVGLARAATVSQPVDIAPVPAALHALRQRTAELE